MFYDPEQWSKYNCANRPNLEEITRKTERPEPTYESEKNKDDEPVEDCLACKNPRHLSRPNSPLWFHRFDREAYLHLRIKPTVHAGTMRHMDGFGVNRPLELFAAI